MTKSCEALLLLGPTGSGKTPLGQLLARRGLCGRQCVHFDFGEHLRQAVAAHPTETELTAEEHRFLADVLATGALLEDQDFHLAERILKAFLRRVDAAKNPWIVLNGLPRHSGQAVAVGRMVNLQLVVQLQCTAEVVRSRILSNQGGDRTGRDDDQFANIQRKLSIYHDRTAPLVKRLADTGAQTVTLDVTETMSPTATWRALHQALSCNG